MHFNQNSLSYSILPLFLCLLLSHFALNARNCQKYEFFLLSPQADRPAKSEVRPLPTDPANRHTGIFFPAFPAKTPAGFHSCRTPDEPFFLSRNNYLFSFRFLIFSKSSLLRVSKDSSISFKCSARSLSEENGRKK